MPGLNIGLDGALLGPAPGFIDPYAISENTNNKIAIFENLLPRCHLEIIFRNSGLRYFPTTITNQVNQMTRFVTINILVMASGNIVSAIIDIISYSIPKSNSKSSPTENGSARQEKSETFLTNVYAGETA